MKRKLCWLFMMLPCVLFAQEGGEYTIQGRIQHPGNAHKAYLLYRTFWNREKVNQLDSSLVVNGQFSFTGNIKQPLLASLVIVPENGAPHGNNPFAEVYLEKGNITIHIKDAVPEAVVTGSPINNAYPVYKQFMQKTIALKKQLDEEVIVAMKENRNTTDFQNTIRVRGEELKKEKEKLQTQFIKKYPDSYMSYVAFKEIVGMSRDTLLVGPLFYALSPGLQQMEEAKYFREIFTIGRKTGVGSIAPDFVQKDSSGQALALSSFRGKYVLIDFWASWCGPCKEELPNIVQAWQAYHNRGFTVLSVSIDKPVTHNVAMNIIRSQQLTWSHVFDEDGKVGQVYGIIAVPQSLLLDPSGKIIAVNLRGQNLPKTLAEVIR